jgi:D-aminopeptidase
MAPGQWNAITDVAGVRVGQVTKIEGDSVRTGVTAVVPHGGNVFQEKVPGAVYVGNGFGKLAGSTQVEELGVIESPVVLTNTLGVAAGMVGGVEWTLSREGNEEVRSVNAVVGETSDAVLNDIRGRHVRREDVVRAIEGARGGKVDEGCVGAGTGTVCFGFKGGIGTASRVLPVSLGGYTVGVLVQSNYGGVLQIDGVPVGKELGKFDFSDQLLNDVDGSCMIVVATDAPLCARNLKRLAKRAFMGLAKTGGIASNGSGDYVVAFSTAEGARVPFRAGKRVMEVGGLHNDHTSPLFMAAIEATEEAIVASLFAAEGMTGHGGRRVEALPLERVVPMLEAYQRVKS